MEYSEKIFKYRAAHGFTQRQMADKLHCSRGTINAIECGRCPASRIMQVRIDSLYEDPAKRWWQK